MKRAALVLLALAAPAASAKPPKEARLCALPQGAQLFLSPMGEPFRATAQEAYPVATWFARADADHDGRIGLAEMVADARRFFTTLDRDHSGEIDPQEVEAYERDVAPEIAIYADRARSWDKPGKRFDMRYGGALGAGRFSFLNIPEPVSSADTDMNRGVSVEEFAQAATRRFAAIDTARQAYLTLATLPKTPAQDGCRLGSRPSPL